MRSQLSVITAAVLVSPALLALATDPAHAAGPRCSGLTATILGTPGKDTISGTGGDDVIVGRAGSDTILGGGGNDVICGGRGGDQIDGGGGNDRVNGQRGRDHLGGGSGSDHLNGGAGYRKTSFDADAGDDIYLTDSGAPSVWVDFTAAPGPVSVDLGAGTASGWGNDTFRFSGADHVNVHGSTHSDTLVGSDRRETFTGGGGFDTIDGKGGGDLLVAKRGVLLGGAGDDRLEFEDTTPDSDVTLDGGPGNDFLQLEFEVSGPPEVFSIAGGDGIDRFFLVGNYPDDDPPGGPVTFNMTTGALDLGGASGTASGFEDFTDSAFAVSTDVVGTDGPNHFDFWYAGPVTLDALAGDDRITGSFGDDTLDGGLGDDTAHGRGGTDTCISIEHADDTSCEILNP